MQRGQFPQGTEGSTKQGVGNFIVGFGRRYGVLGLQGEDARRGEGRPPSCAQGYESTLCGGGDAHPELTHITNMNRTDESRIPR